MTFRAFATSLGALALAGCGNPLASPPNNQVAARRGAPATVHIAITASGPENCATTFDGTPVAQPALLERMVAEMRRAVETAGGIDAAIDRPSEQVFPTIEVDAPADMRFSCIGQTVATIQRSGTPSIRLARTGDPARLTLYSFIPGSEAPADMVTVSGGGRITWNGQPIDLAGLRQHAPRSSDAPPPEEPPPSSSAPIPPGVVQSPPGTLAIVAAPEATVAEVYEVAAIFQTGTPILIPPGAAVPRSQEPATTAPGPG